ncbi:MAG: TerB family tellurite resistance protein [Deltaproteobacteria bacterium]|nr:TerB family tellurite resistance protein [Deltaproteobacteria bacterium]
MLSQLSSADRLRLMKFVCSFAWADLDVSPEERAFIARLVRGLDLDRDEEIRVHEWLDVPPELEGLAPTDIPSEHRRFFIEAIEGVISADGRIAAEERDNLEIFRQLLG